jgi:hypothetical protein
MFFKVHILQQVHMTNSYNFVYLQFGVEYNTINFMQ